MAGVVFDRKSAERIARTVREWERRPRNVSAGGPSPLPEVRRDTLPAKNFSPDAAIECGVGMIVGIGEDGYTFLVRTPPTQGQIDLGIWTSAVASGGHGLVYVFGTHKAAVANHAAIAVGDSVGSGVGSPYAFKQPGGPWTVVEKLQDPYVMVDMDGKRRLDNKYFETTDNACDGAYEVLFLGADKTMVEVAGRPGVWAFDG